MVELKPPQELEQELQRYDMEDDIPNLQCGKEFSVKINLDRNPKAVSMIILGLATDEKLKQNNWRKLHGLPMMHRLRK